MYLPPSPCTASPCSIAPYFPAMRCGISRRLNLLLGRFDLRTTLSLSPSSTLGIHGNTSGTLCCNAYCMSHKNLCPIGYASLANW